MFNSPAQSCAGFVDLSLRQLLDPAIGRLLSDSVALTATQDLGSDCHSWPTIAQRLSAAQCMVSKQLEARWLSVLFVATHVCCVYLRKARLWLLLAQERCFAVGRPASHVRDPRPCGVCEHTQAYQAELPVMLTLSFLTKGSSYFEHCVRTCLDHLHVTSGLKKWCSVKYDDPRGNGIPNMFRLLFDS